MPEQPSPLTLERLLAHEDFVRFLARRLLEDADLADDVVQETWLAAVERPPRAMGSLRAWLARLAANFARMRRRHERRLLARERLAARPEALPSTDEVLERETIRRKVVQAVLSLQDPHRTCVLLRYYDDLPPREIARRLAIPIATARSRLRRAHQMLRVELGKELGPERSRWLAALAPLAAPAHSVVAILAEAIVMSTRVKIGIAALLIVAAPLVLLSVLDRTQPSDGRSLSEPMAATNVPDTKEPRPSSAPMRVEVPATTDAAPALAEDELEAYQCAGRVVDERRFPVVGANVTLRLAGREARARTDARGLYRIAAGPREATWADAAVHARDGRGRAGVLAAHLGPEPRYPGALDDLGTLVLLPASALHVRVLDGERCVPGAEVTLESGMARIRAANDVADEKGEVIFREARHGPATVVASFGELNGIRHVELPLESEEPLQVRLEPSVSLEVLVTRTDRTPLKGATILAKERLLVTSGPVDKLEGSVSSDRTLTIDVPETDERGITRVDELRNGAKLMVTAVAPGYAPQAWYPAEAGKDERVTVDLRPLSTIRLNVVPGEAAVPAEGTCIAIKTPVPADPLAPDPSGIMRDGNLVIDGISFLHPSLALAQTPDGALARINQQEVAFRKPRHVEVCILDEDGKPYPGAVISTRQDDPARSPWGVTRPRISDAQGKAVIEGLYGGCVVIDVQRAGSLDKEIAGTVDVEQGDARIEYRLKPRVELVLRMKVAGEPRLPSFFSLHAGDRRVQDWVEDPQAGEVRLFVARELEPTMKITVDSRGFRRATAEVDLTNTSPPHVAELELQPTASLIAHVEPPPDGCYTIDAERWDPISGSWVFGASPSAAPEMKAEGPWRFEELVPGLYRVHDKYSDIASVPIDVVAGMPTREVTLFLGKSGWTRGHVAVPQGYDVQQARVCVDRKDRSQDETGGRVERTGEFKVRLPGDRPVTLRALHALLMPDEASGSLEITHPTDGIILRLVEGPQAQFTIDPAQAAQQGEWRISLFRGNVSDKPLSRHVPELKLKGATCRFGAFAAGSYTLWIDPGRAYAPLLLKEVWLGEGRTDLGEIEFKPGSTVHIRVLVAEGATLPRLSGWLLALDAPSYSRHTLMDGTSKNGLSGEGPRELQVPGLSRGRFRIVVVREIDEKMLMDREIAVDGSSDLTFDLDLR
ncbi:MAG: sigma-70 family RNA polymerase sigma factor [Planctomycetota bacterium]